jgi:WD40 repeat protein
MDENESSGDESNVTLFGHRNRSPRDSVQNTVYGAQEDGDRYNAFTGHIAEVLTVFGDSSSAGLPNDTNTTFPTITGGIPPDPSDPDVYGVHSAGTGPAYQWSDTVANAPGTLVANFTEVEAIEGYLAHKWGLQELLESTDPTPELGPISSTGGNNGTQDLSGLSNHHPYGGAGNDPPTTGGGGGPATSASKQALGSTRPVLAKFGPNFGELQYALNGSGLGYGVVADFNDDLFTVGPLDASDSGNTTAMARKVIDQGTTYSVDTADGAWTIVTGGDSTLVQTYKYPKLLVHPGHKSTSGGNFIWPIANTNYANHIRRIRGETQQTTVTGGNGGDTIWEHSLDDAVQVYGVALAPNAPNYPEVGDDDGEDSVTGPEFIYVASDNGGDPDTPTLLKLETVTSTRQTGQPREVTYVAVAGGDIRTFNNTSTVTEVDTTQTLETDSDFIMSTVLFEKVYYTDGLKYLVFDPRAGDTDNTSGTVKALESRNAGEIPPRAKIISAWRGRLVLAHLDDPASWAMSKVGDPRDWNQAPKVITADQAISSSNTGFTVGANPDVINAFIPIDDDVALMGGDHSLHALTGDPAAGGVIDLVSDITGIAFGRAWAKDPRGVLYFFGSRGGVYAMRPGHVPVSISEGRIERTLQEINLATYKVRLAWNYYDRGLHVFLTPWGGAWSATVQHWFWDYKNDAWWEDQIDDQSTQPTAVHVLDGDDPDDRKLVIGSEDGFIRLWDKDTLNDGATVPIDSFVVVGPIVPTTVGREVRYSHFTATLADDQDSCMAEFFPEEEPDVLTGPQHTQGLVAGRNPLCPFKSKASGMWIRLRNAHLSERWSLEEMRIRVSPAGRSRVRQ